jgi:membrane associated rhomboid family serine protease
MPTAGNPPSRSAPWLAADLLAEASLGGQAGVWRGKSELMGLAEIASRLRDQEANEKTPVDWIEVPNSPRVVHVSEVPELWAAQTERDLRHAQATINRNRTLVIMIGIVYVTVLAFGVSPKSIFLFAILSVQLTEAWFSAAETKRLLGRDASGYFHRCSREKRYLFWIESQPALTLWRTWSLSTAWVVLFIIQMYTGMKASIQCAGLVKPLVWQGEVWRLLTGTMLHGHLGHILMNVAAAILMARLIERTVHRHILVPLWLLGALGGSLCSLRQQKLRKVLTPKPVYCIQIKLSAG